MTRVQEELKVFDISFEVLKTYEPDFKNDERAKQSFYLNIYNFLILYKIAVLMICEPEAISTLTNYNRW